MRKVSIALLSLLLLVGSMSMAMAQSEFGPGAQDHILNARGAQSHNSAQLAPGQFKAAAALDTVWYGFVTGGTASTTGVGGKWDFDRKPNGAQALASDPDALQGWTPWVTPFLSGGARPASNRPEWFLNYGNHGQYWHQQDMTLIAGRTGGPANTNIAGAGVAWCGLDKPVFITTLHDYRTTPRCSVESPGYGDAWDQYLVKDITINGVGNMTFSYRTDMDIQRADDGTEAPQNGTQFDQLDVYVGIPTVGIPHGSAIPANADMAALVGVTDTLVANLKGLAAPAPVTTGNFGAGAGGIGSVGRVIFRVRTNRTISDQSGYGAFNDGVTGAQRGSAAGAAQIDDVYFSNAVGTGDGLGLGVGNRYTFDANLQGWTPTAKPVPAWSHIINVGNNDPNVGGLGYDVLSPDSKWADPCGPPGNASSLCNMKNNVLAQFDPISHGLDATTHPFDHYSFNNWPIAFGENQQAAFSPNVHTAGTPGAGRSGLVLQVDFYSYLPVNEAVFFWTWLRFKPGVNGAFPCPNYASWQRDPVIYNTDQPACGIFTVEQSQLVSGVAGMTDIEVLLGSPALCYAFGDAGVTGTCLGNLTTLWDNARVGLWNAPVAPQAVIFDWQFPQDGFPVDNIVANYLPMQKRAVGGTRTNASPYLKTASSASHTIDAQTAISTANLTLNDRPHEADGNGQYQADSLSIQVGLSAAGSRADLVFRVLPGPLTNTSDPWFAAYKTNTGDYGTGSTVGGPYGTHGGSWKWYIWNSAQMDTGELDAYDTTKTNATNVIASGASSYFSTSIIESDVHYNTLGIMHCLPLVDDVAGHKLIWLEDCNHFGVNTREHTPIWPNYVFTPGTQVDYFYRLSYNTSPTTPNLFPDTTAVNSLGSKYFTWRILPDAWKDPFYGANPKGVTGVGRACVLYVDHSFGLSQGYFAYKGALDSNGIDADYYTSQAPSSGESGIGNAVGNLANPTFTHYGSSGPSLNQLSGYRQIYYNCTALGSGSIADGQNDGDASADVQLLDAWLKVADGRKRFLWLNGTSIALNLDVNRPDASPSQTFARDVLGISQNSVDGNDPQQNYRTLSNDYSDCPTVIAGSAPWSALQQTAVTGNLCFFNYDVIPPNGGVGAASSQLYQIGNRSAGVIRTQGVLSKTLIDALDFPQVRNVGCHDNYGRIYQMRTVFEKYASSTGIRSGAFCDAVLGAATGVGNPTRGFQTTLSQNTPNPFRPARATTIRYSVGRKALVSLTIHDVSGRVVRSIVNRELTPGEYSAVWDGTSNNGEKLAGGVYFSRLKVGDVEANRKMLMLK